MDPEEFKKYQVQLPNEPGIYRYIGDNEKVLYVGKAKNLKKRVSSYFNKNHDSARLTILVRKIRHIEVTVVNNEQEALQLENSLIKKHKPKYNIMLKDDKTYPYIVIKNERFPRIFFTRIYENDGSQYLGPYTSVRRAEAVLQMLTSIYPLRTCGLNLSEKNVDGGKFKVCLEYHIGNCKGPCQARQSEEDYNNSVAQIRKILMGQSGAVVADLKEQMKVLSENYEYEAANALKLKVDTLNTYHAKSAIVNHAITDVDVFTIAEEGEYAFVNYFKVANGSIIQTKGMEMKRSELEETTEELLCYAIAEIRQHFQSTSKEILLPIPVEYEEEDAKLTISVPQIGDKKKLVQLSMKNALYMRNKHIEEKNNYVKKKGPNRVLEQLQKDFNLPVLPEHIECFDNSNIQGTTPVASMVCFKDGKPSKKDYRHFNIKTVEGANDFASMEEIVYRRYSRLLEENQPLPQLVVIDGGKGQLNAAIAALEKLDLMNRLSVASIAKRLEEIYFPGDPTPLHISKRSESLRLIQFMRNEAHRFAITFHRDKRTKKAMTPGLTKLKGIGEKTSLELLKKFKSLKKLKLASLEEIAEVVGASKAQLVFEQLHIAPTDDVDLVSE